MDTTQASAETTARQRELVAGAQAAGPDGREAFVEAFLPLIGSVARMYRGRSAVQWPELMQAGVLGLMEALERYDPSLGTPFWAYASWWVRAAMQDVVSELAWPVVLSDRAQRQLARVKDARGAHLQRHRREPTCAELAAGTGMPCDQVERLVAAQRAPRALQERVGGDTEAGVTCADVLADPDAEDAYDRVLASAEAGRVRALLDSLNARERWVLTQRFCLEGPAPTLRELGRVLGLSAERVRQTELGALEKLRATFLARDPGADAVEGPVPRARRRSRHGCQRHYATSAAGRAAGRDRRAMNIPGG